MKNLQKVINLKLILVTRKKQICKGGLSICLWTGNEDFQYGISRFWEKCSGERVYSTLDGTANY